MRFPVRLSDLWMEVGRWRRELTAEGVLVGVSVVVLHHDLLGDGNDVLIVGVLNAARSHTSVVESGLTGGDVGLRTDTNGTVSDWPRNHAWCQKDRARTEEAHTQHM